MGFDKTWLDGVYLHAIVKEGHTALSINPYPGHVFDPIPSLERVGIQEGSLCVTYYALGIPSWGAFGGVTFPGGSGLPSLVPCPLCGLNSVPFWLISPTDNP